MSVANLHAGLAAQIGIATNALHDKRTRVVPTDFLEFESESVADDLPLLRKQGMAGTLGPRVGRVRPIDTGHANGATVHTLLTKGYARLLKHILPGYTFSWPGATNGSATLTFNSAATNNDTVVIEGQTYTFKTSLTASTTANEIKVASSAILQASYFAAAVNRGVASDGNGSGVAYGSLTPQNSDVIAVDNGDGTVTVSDRQARGVAVNSGGASEVATTETLTDASSVWSSATLTGGVDGTDTRRLHTYTLDPEAMREIMATLQIVRPSVDAASAVFEYIAKVVSAQFACSDGDALMVTPTWDSLARSTDQTAASASYPSAATFYDYTQIGVTLGGTTEPVQGVSLSIETAQAARSQFGQAALLDHLMTDRPSVTGELTHEFRNTDIFDDWIAGTTAALVITATGAQIPSSASNYQLLLDCGAIIFTGSTPQVGGPGVVQQNIPFEALDNGSDPWVRIRYYTDEGYAGDNG